MGNHLKETRHAPAAKAEVRLFSTGKAALAPENPDATRDRLSSVQEPPARTPRVPDLRDVPGPGSHPASGTRSRELTSPALAVAPFLSLTDPVHVDRAFVFPGQGAQSVGMGKDLYDQFPAARELYDRRHRRTRRLLRTITD